MEARFSEDYTLAVYASGGVRLWLDGQLIIDHMDGGGRFFSTPVHLTAGQHYRLRLLPAPHDRHTGSAPVLGEPQSTHRAHSRQLSVPGGGRVNLLSCSFFLLLLLLKKTE